MAKKYSELNDAAKMFDCLEKSADHALKYDTQKDGMYTSFIVNKVDYSTLYAYKNYSENESGLLLKALKGERYKQFETDPRMVKLTEKLTSAARF